MPNESHHLSFNLPTQILNRYLWRVLLTSPGFLMIIPIVTAASSLLNQVEAICGHWGGIIALTLVCVLISLLSIRPRNQLTEESITLTTMESGLLLKKGKALSFHHWSSVLSSKRKGDKLLLTFRHSEPLALNISHLSAVDKYKLTSLLQNRAGKGDNADTFPPPEELATATRIAGSHTPRAAICNAERSAIHRTNRRYALLALALLLADICLHVWSPDVPELNIWVMLSMAALVSLYLLLPHSGRSYSQKLTLRSNGSDILVQYPDSSWLSFPAEDLFNACSHRYGVHYDTPYIPRCGISAEHALPDAPRPGHCHPYRNSIILMLLLYALAYTALLRIQQEKGYRIYLGCTAYALNDCSQAGATQEQIRGALALILQRSFTLKDEMKNALKNKTPLSVQQTPHGNYIFTLHEEEEIRLLVSPDGRVRGGECTGEKSYWILNGGIREN